MPGGKLTCIIVTHNNENEIKACLDAVLSGDTKPSVAVFDNASSDRTVEILRSYDGRISFTVSAANIGYAKACNKASSNANTEYLCFLNPDATVSRDTLSILIDFMDSHPDCAICGPELLDSRGKPANSAAALPTLADQLLPKSILKALFPKRYYPKGSIKTAAEVESLVGACLMVRVGAFAGAGGFCEEYFVFLEETELCRVVGKKGGKVYLVPEAKVTHLGGRSKQSYGARARIEYLKSLIKYFERNHSKATFLLLLLALPVKALVETLLNLVLNALTFLTVRELRKRLALSAATAVWGLLMYPGSWGIAGGEKGRL